ncbi:MAG: SpoIIE family protein phosphatase, partial [Alphaproteobacteria bacterium]|nr:SpoIIE family protein phosphatase [Alphaproteobacteria bacterium]
KMFGGHRLIQNLTHNADDNSPKNLAAKLYENVKEFVAGAEPNDDITIVAIRYRG